MGAVVQDVGAQTTDSLFKFQICGLHCLSSSIIQFGGEQVDDPLPLVLKGTRQ